MVPRSLFSKRRLTPRPLTTPQAAPHRRIPLSPAEVAQLRARLLDGHDEVDCPRCGTTTRVAPPFRDTSRGVLLWFVSCKCCARRVTIRAYPSGHVNAPKFDRLVASGPVQRPDRRSLFAGIGGGAIPVAVLAMMAIVTARSTPVEPTTRRDTTTVMLAYDEMVETRRDERRVTQATAPPPPAPTPPSTPTVVPVSVPVGVDVDLPVTVDEVVFDPRQHGRYQTDATVFAGHSQSSEDDWGGENGDSRKVFRVAVVDEPPVYLSGPSLRYPRLLREAQIEGYVVLEFVLDANGRPDSSSIVATFATNPAFVRSAIAVLVRSYFRPARLRGTPVPVLVEQNVEFSLASRSK